MHTVHSIKIHQYRVQILYKPELELPLTDWLSWHNHQQGKDEPIPDMDLRVDAIQSTTDIPECISILQIQQATAQDEHLQCLKNTIITGWPSTKDQLNIDIRPYWSYRDNQAVLDGIVIKGRGIIVPQELMKQVLDQLHLNHMAIKKNLLIRESVYWVNINNDIENHVKNCNTCLEFQ